MFGIRFEHLHLDEDGAFGAHREAIFRPRFFLASAAVGLLCLVFLFPLTLACHRFAVGVVLALLGFASVVVALMAGKVP